MGFHSFSQLSCTKGLHMACCHDPKFVVFYINLSHFSWDRSQRRIALCLNAPKKGQSLHAQLETKVLDSKQVEENKRSAKQRINVFRPHGEETSGGCGGPLEAKIASSYRTFMSSHASRRLNGIPLLFSTFLHEGFAHGMLP